MLVIAKGSEENDKWGWGNPKFGAVYLSYFYVAQPLRKWTVLFLN